MKKLHILLPLLSLSMALMASPGDIMVGSRANSMGGAHTAVVNDPSASYWNPGALSKVESLSLLFNYWILQDVENVNVTYTSVAVPIAKVGTFSGSWLMQSAELEEGYDPSTGGAMATNGFSENQFSVSYGRELWDTLAFFRETSVGLSFNRYAIFSEEEDDEGTGFGLDFSANIGFPGHINVAFMARNIASDLMGEKIDPELRWGIGYSGQIGDMHRLTADFDAAMKRNRDYQDLSTLEYQDKFWKFYGGLEYALLINELEISLSGGAGWAKDRSIDNVSYGFGGGLKIYGQALQYAFNSGTEETYSLGNIHRLSLILDLGRMAKSSSEKE